MKRLLLAMAVVVCCIPFIARGETFSFDFSSNYGPYFEEANTGSLWTLSTANQQLSISKPADDGSFIPTWFVYGGLYSSFTLEGDFSATVDFTLNNFPLANGNPGLNEAMLQVIEPNTIPFSRTQPDYAEVLRFTTNSSSLIEAYADPPDLPYGTSVSTVTSGRFRLERTGTLLTASYAQFGSAVFVPLGSVDYFPNTVNVALVAAEGCNDRRNGVRSSTPMDVSFDNLAITADKINYVPEPSTLALLSMGGIGLIAWGWRRRKANRIVVCFIALLASTAGMASADVFNMGPGLTSLNMVSVGNLGNSADAKVMNDGTTGYGTVNYSYSIGKYDVTAGQYTEFLNAVASTSDAYCLYNSAMEQTPFGSKIIYDSSTHTYTAALPNQPVNYITWSDAVRFCNWLQNGQKTYTQDPLTTEHGSYTLNGHMDDGHLMAVTRNPGFQYYLPTENEWYKAAYYDPNKGGTGEGGYWLYPTKSDIVPSNILSSTGTNNANYWNDGFTLSGPPYTTEVGSFANSPSAYGTFDQGGNVFQWNETIIDSNHRGLRGGSFTDNVPSNLSSFGRVLIYNSAGWGDVVGFRVASVPEPGSPAMMLSIVVGGLLFWRRRKA